MVAAAVIQVQLGVEIGGGTVAAAGLEGVGVAWLYRDFGNFLATVGEEDAGASAVNLPRIGRGDVIVIIRDGSAPVPIEFIIAVGLRPCASGPAGGVAIGEMGGLVAGVDNPAVGGVDTKTHLVACCGSSGGDGGGEDDTDIAD